MPTWKERIETAKQAWMFSADDRVAARNWNTCAFSELPIPLQLEPVDLWLFNLACNFVSEVVNDNVLAAESIYNQMHERAKELIAIQTTS